MNNFGMGFGWGQAGMGGGSQMPWGGAFNQGRRGLGGLPQVSPYQQQRPVLPPMSQPRPVSPMPQRMPPARQGIMNPPAQNRFQTPLHPPQSAAYGANQGVMGGRGPASQAGSIPDPTPYLNRELQNPGFQPGFLSVPPEALPNEQGYRQAYPQQKPVMPPSSPPQGQFSIPDLLPLPEHTPTPPQMSPPIGANPSKAPLPQSFHEQGYRDYQNSNPSATGRSSFSVSPATQNDPTYRSMEQQQRNFGYKDQNLPRYQSSVDEVNRQADVMENTMLPDVNDPSFRGITPQEAFQQIPGNPFSKMGDRFTAISAKPSSNVVNQSAMNGMAASQATSTMPNYGQRYADAERKNLDFNPEYIPVDVNAPAYSTANGYVTPRGSITPQPRAGDLTVEEARRMQAVGSSIGEWKAKADWMKSKGIAEYTPEVAQAYTAEQQQKRFARNDQEDMARQRDNQRLDVDRQWRMRRRDQNFRYNNPMLFNTPDFTAAQLAAVMAGAPISQFQQPGVTPAQALQAELQVRQQNVTQAQTQAAMGMNAEAEQTLKGTNPMMGMGYGQQQQFQPTAPPQPQLYSDQYRPTQPPTGVGMTDPNAVVRRGQEHRNEDGSISPGTFYPKLLANMGSAQQIVSSGINEEDIRQYIKSQEQWGWNSPDNQRRIDNAKKALALIAPQSATGNAASSAVSGAGNPVPLGVRL